MWEALGEGRVDGVLYVDPVLLRHILTVTGPVVLGDESIAADNVIAFLDQLQYFGEFGNAESRAQRQDVLRELVDTVLSAVREGPADRALARELFLAGRRRHIMLWTPSNGSDPTEQLGSLAGTVDATTLAPSVSLMSGKFAPYVQTSFALAAECDNAAVAVTLTVDMTFRDDIPLHDYLAGSVYFPSDPEPRRSTRAGHLPGRGACRRQSLLDPAAINGPDGPTRQWATWRQLARGATDSVDFTFTVPSQSRITVAPSGTGYARDWTFENEAWDSSATPRELTMPDCSEPSSSTE